MPSDSRGSSPAERRLTSLLPGGTAFIVAVGDVDLAVETTGAGDPVLLLHGFPHTRAIWCQMAPLLVCAGLRIVAPDLRGLGESGQTSSGYDARTLASDLCGLLDALELDRVHVVGFDLGAAPALALAMERSERVLSLTIIEALLGGLDLGGGKNGMAEPWWFGFHQASSGLAEDVLVGHEARYVEHFLGLGSRRGLPADLTAHLVESYQRPGALRSAFEHYRAMPANARRAAAWAVDGHLDMPVLVVGGSVVGDLPARQLEPYTDRVAIRVHEDSGHIVPIDAPGEAADVIVELVRHGREIGGTTARRAQEETQPS